MKRQPEISWINLEEWARKTHFESFTKHSKCIIHASCHLEVDILHDFCKNSGLRFYPMMVLLVTEIANRISEFRITLSEARLPGVWNFVSPVYTVWHDDDNTFSSICTEYDDNRNKFYQAILCDMERYKDVKGHIVTQVPPNILPISCIPDLNFSSFTIQPCGESVYGESVAPTVIWGKFFRHEGKLLMPVSISVHHAAADGYHVSQFFNQLQELCNEGNYL